LDNRDVAEALAVVMQQTQVAAVAVAVLPGVVSLFMQSMYV
jgi:hypothetical protein